MRQFAYGRWLFRLGPLPLAALILAEHEWYLLAYHDVSIKQQQEYGPTVSDVLISP